MKKLIRNILVGIASLSVFFKTCVREEAAIWNFFKKEEPVIVNFFKNEKKVAPIFPIHFPPPKPLPPIHGSEEIPIIKPIIPIHSSEEIPTIKPILPHSPGFKINPVELNSFFNTIDKNTYDLNPDVKELINRVLDNIGKISKVSSLDDLKDQNESIAQNVRDIAKKLSIPIRFNENTGVITLYPDSDQNVTINNVYRLTKSVAVLYYASKAG